VQLFCGGFFRFFYSDAANARNSALAIAGARGALWRDTFRLAFRADFKTKDPSGGVATEKLFPKLGIKKKMILHRQGGAMCAKVMARLGKKKHWTGFLIPEVEGGGFKRRLLDFDRSQTFFQVTPAKSGFNFFCALPPAGQCSSCFATKAAFRFCPPS